MYDAFPKNGEYHVYKLGADAEPVGDALGKHGTRTAAIAHLRTLLIETDEKEFKPSAVEQAHEHPRGTVLKTYAAPKPTGVFSRRKEGITVYKGDDGLRLMFIVTSNSYQDRDNETITTKALQDYVESAWTVEDKCLPRNEFLFWHKGQAIGDVIWTDMEGPFLLEIVKERKNKVVGLSPRHKTSIKQLWDVFETAPIRWGASHGFKYHKSAKTVDGIYKAIAKFETSILPLDAAANPYTFAGVIDEMNRDQVLDSLLKTPDAAKRFRKGIRAVGDALKQQGLQHKAVNDTATKGMVEDIRAMVEKIAAKWTDQPSPESIDEASQMFIAGLTSMAPAAPVEAEVEDEVEIETTEVDPIDEPVTVSPEMTSKQVKLFDTMLRTAEAQAQDMADLADAVKSVAKAVLPIPEAQANVTKALEDLDKRMKMVESRFGGAPKRASQAETTIVTDEALTKAVKEQNEKFEELFPGSGIKLKPE